MTNQELAQVLAVMQAAWPSFSLTDETVQVWYSQVCQYDVRDAKEAAVALVRSDDRFPTIARFVEHTRMASRRRHDLIARDRGLNQGPPDYEFQLAQVRKLRAELAELLAKQKVN